ncbi:MAG: hypothetical protein ACOC9E_00175 [Chloroflexota bacterium]
MNTGELLNLGWRPWLKRLTALIACLLALSPSTSTARAHGGGTAQLTNEDIGPYWISVWTSPEPVREGTLHVTVSVAEPGEEGERQAGPPVLDATVDLLLIPPEETMDAVSADATTEQSANKLFYEADMQIPAAGEWRAQIDVRSEEGSGQAAFDLAVQPAQNSSLLLPAGAALLVIAAFFFFYSARRRGHG